MCFSYSWIHKSQKFIASQNVRSSTCRPDISPQNCGRDLDLVNCCVLKGAGIGGCSVESKAWWELMLKTESQNEGERECAAVLLFHKGCFVTNLWEAADLCSAFECPWNLVCTFQGTAGCWLSWKVCTKRNEAKGSHKRHCQHLQCVLMRCPLRKHCVPLKMFCSRTKGPYKYHTGQHLSRCTSRGKET